MNIAYNVDCMEYMRTLADGEFDLAVVDPPYGLPKDSANGRGKLKNRTFNRGNISRWDIPPEAAYFAELLRVSKNQVIWGVITSISRRAGASSYGIKCSRSRISADANMRGRASISRQSCSPPTTDTRGKYIRRKSPSSYTHGFIVCSRRREAQFSTLTSGAAPAGLPHGTWVWISWAAR